jgi:hypothetical protein
VWLLLVNGASGCDVCGETLGRPGAVCSFVLLMEQVVVTIVVSTKIRMRSGNSEGYIVGKVREGLKLEDNLLLWFEDLAPEFEDSLYLNLRPFSIIQGPLL